MILSQLQRNGLLLLFLACAGHIAVAQEPVSRSTIDSVARKNAEIKRNLDIMDSFYSRIVTSYVENVDPEKLMRKGINGMLAALDPFTKYRSKAEAEEFNRGLSGKFGGIGLMLRDVDHNIMISQVFQDRPAEKAGLKAGDIILSVDGRSFSTKSMYDIFPFLRGTPGTTVKVTARRPGVQGDITAIIVREEIVQSSVPYYGVLQGDIGYIQFSGFTKECSESIKKAFLEMKSNYKLKGLVLDLRYNPGGFLQEAIKISNFFLEKGTKIVETIGKSEGDTVYASLPALDANIPLVLLTSNNTASASEILSGAIQDNDRGVIIGERTFGKGLVGVIFDLSSGSQLQLTIAHYYTPSGRCIQAKNYPGNGGQGVAIADSLKRSFKTANGRTVRDADGITPDIIITTQKQPAVADWLQDNNILFKYANQYFLEHTSILPPMQFHLTDPEYEQFLATVPKNEFAFKATSEDKINELRNAVKEDGYGAGIDSMISVLQSQLRQEKQNDLSRYKQTIRDLLEDEIAARYYNDKGRILSALRNDPLLAKAFEIINNPGEYRKTLAKIQPGHL
jgi:carboxyl-terminal processing protease